MNMKHLSIWGFHNPPPPPQATLSIWTFEDWFVQIPHPSSRFDGPFVVKGKISQGNFLFINQASEPLCAKENTSLLDISLF